MARPTKLTDEVREKICEAIRKGNYLETAAAYAGIGISTFYDWIRRGDQTRGSKFSDFSEAVKKARAEAEAHAVAVIRDAAHNSWQAAAWWLERSFPDRWGRTHRDLEARVVAMEAQFDSDEDRLRENSALLQESI